MNPPISFRAYDPDRDHPEIMRWWSAHGSPGVQRDLLPRGLIASASGVELAASFLYMDAEKIGVIEWAVTNPKVAIGPDLVAAVKGLYRELEAQAVAAGCRAVMSFVKPGSWEERTMAKAGYGKIGGEHLLYAKFPKQEAQCP